MAIEECVRVSSCENNHSPNPMLTQIQIQQIQGLRQSGKSLRQIASLVAVSRNSVRKYLRQPQVATTQKNFLETNAMEVRCWFLQCQGHCVPLVRKIREETGVKVKLRTLQRFCKPLRSELRQTKRQTRYETAPGVQMQIDFGEKDVVLDGTVTRVHLFVAVLSFSRRIYVKAYPAENQAVWLDGLESAFAHFQGIPITVLSDNSSCLVQEHRRGKGAVLRSKYDFFCHYWNFTAVVSSPYYPESKGKVERAVRYVKDNALIGKDFKDLPELNRWLEEWTLTDADNRVLDSFIQGVRIPRERFLLEKDCLQHIDKPRIGTIREETRKVNSSGLIRIDNAYYRLPDAVRNVSVQTLITDSTITVSKGGTVIMELDKARQVYQPGEQSFNRTNPLPALPPVQEQYAHNSLQRPLETYSQATGGAW